MDSLFDIVITTEEINEEYRILKDKQRYQEDKLFVESLWENFRPYADTKFREEFARNPHQRFWEMYLANALLAQNHHLLEKERKKSPDICVQNQEKKVWVEAIAPEAGKGGLLLRFTSAIKEKHEKYLFYSNEDIVSPEEPYVIAINGRQVPKAWPDDDDIPLIVKAVLPFGDPSHVYDFSTNEVVSASYSYRPEIRTRNNAPVFTTIFQDSSYSRISGILFSLVNVWNRPSSLGSDFLFIHNPLATNRLPFGWLGTGNEYWVEDGKLEKRLLM